MLRQPSQGINLFGQGHYLGLLERICSRVKARRRLKVAAPKKARDTQKPSMDKTRDVVLRNGALGAHQPDSETVGSGREKAVGG
jgi:hypothetical protein